MKQWKRYKSYILPYKSAFILGPLMMVTEVLGEILLPKFMSMIINHGVAQKDGGYILKMGLVMAITSFLMAAGGILGAYFAAKASISFTSDLRRDLFARVQQFSFKNIDTFSTGSLVTRLTNDIQQVQNLIMMGLRMMLRAPGMFLGALVMAFWMNADLAAVILVVIPLLTAAIVWILRTAYPRFTAMQKALDTLNSGIQEVLTLGADGELLCTADVLYVNGEEVERAVLSETVTRAPVAEIIAIGTGVDGEASAPDAMPVIADGYITLPTGEVLTYSDTATIRATAYTHTDAGCDMTTYTGTTVHKGTVAVDPRYIPYGTRMFIVSNDGAYVYGISVAEDCGGDIKGDRMDLYFPPFDECIQFGRRVCTIYFLD